MGYYGHGTGLNSSLAAPTKSPKAHEAEYDEDAYAWDDEAAVSNALEYENLSRVLHDAEADTLEYMLEQCPITTVNAIMGQFTATPTRFAAAEDLPSYEQDIYNALLDGDVAAMQDFVRDGRAAVIVAEVMCYYVEWQTKMTATRPLLPAML
jgi:hypothetical protein